jgi:hypothetical protein
LFDGVTYSIVALTTFEADCAGSVALLFLFTDGCLVKRGCCDFTVPAWSKYVRVISSINHKNSLKTVELADVGKTELVTRLQKPTQQHVFPPIRDVSAYVEKFL